MKATAPVFSSHCYTRVHGQPPHGRGAWGFIGPRGEVAWAPPNLTLLGAQKWLTGEVRAGHQTSGEWLVAP